MQHGESGYYAVIFSSTLHTSDPEYSEMAQWLEDAAHTQEGFLGIESCRNADGFGITVSYWRDEACIRAWKEHAEHSYAREKGRTLWYASYHLRVAKVERAYSFQRN